MREQALMERLGRSIERNGRPAASERWANVAEACRHVDDALAELSAEAACAPDGRAFRDALKRLVEGGHNLVGFDALRREADLRAADVSLGDR